MLEGHLAQIAIVALSLHFYVYALKPMRDMTDYLRSGAIELEVFVIASVSRTHFQLGKLFSGNPDGEFVLFIVHFRCSQAGKF